MAEIDLPLAAGPVSLGEVADIVLPLPGERVSAPSQPDLKQPVKTLTEKPPRKPTADPSIIEEATHPVLLALMGKKTGRNRAGKTSTPVTPPPVTAPNDTVATTPATLAEQAHQVAKRAGADKERNLPDPARLRHQAETWTTHPETAGSSWAKPESVAVPVRKGRRASPPAQTVPWSSSTSGIVLLSESQPPASSDRGKEASAATPHPSDTTDLISRRSTRQMIGLDVWKGSASGVAVLSMPDSALAPANTQAAKNGSTPWVAAVGAADAQVGKTGLASRSASADTTPAQVDKPGPIPWSATPCPMPAQVDRPGPAPRPAMDAGIDKPGPASRKATAARIDKPDPASRPATEARIDKPGPTPWTAAGAEVDKPGPVLWSATASMTDIQAENPGLAPWLVYAGQVHAARRKRRVPASTIAAMVGSRIPAPADAKPPLDKTQVGVNGAMPPEKTQVRETGAMPATLRATTPWSVIAASPTGSTSPATAGVPQPAPANDLALPRQQKKGLPAALARTTPEQAPVTPVSVTSAPELNAVRTASGPWWPGKPGQSAAPSSDQQVPFQAAAQAEPEEQNKETEPAVETMTLNKAIPVTGKGRPDFVDLVNHLQWHVPQLSPVAADPVPPPSAEADAGLSAWGALVAQFGTRRGEVKYGFCPLPVVAVGGASDPLPEATAQEEEPVPPAGIPWRKSRLEPAGLVSQATTDAVQPTIRELVDTRDGHPAGPKKDSPAKETQQNALPEETKTGTPAENVQKDSTPEAAQKDSTPEAARNHDTAHETGKNVPAQEAMQDSTPKASHNESGSSAQPESPETPLTASYHKRSTTPRIPNSVRELGGFVGHHPLGQSIWGLVSKKTFWKHRFAETAVQEIKRRENSFKGPKVPFFTHGWPTIYSTDVLSGPFGVLWNEHAAPGVSAMTIGLPATGQFMPAKKTEHHPLAMPKFHVEGILDILGQPVFQSQSWTSGRRTSPGRFIAYPPPVPGRRTKARSDWWKTISQGDSHRSFFQNAHSPAPASTTPEMATADNTTEKEKIAASDRAWQQLAGPAEIQNLKEFFAGLRTTTQKPFENDFLSATKLDLKMESTHSTPSGYGKDVVDDRNLPSSPVPVIQFIEDRLVPVITLEPESGAQVERTPEKIGSAPDSSTRTVEKSRPQAAVDPVPMPTDPVAPVVVIPVASVPVAPAASVAAAPVAPAAQVVMVPVAPVAPDTVVSAVPVVMAPVTSAAPIAIVPATMTSPAPVPSMDEIVHDKAGAQAKAEPFATVKQVPIGDDVNNMSEIQAGTTRPVEPVSIRQESANALDLDEMETVQAPAVRTTPQSNRQESTSSLDLDEMGTVQAPAAKAVPPKAARQQTARKPSDAIPVEDLATGFANLMGDGVEGVVKGASWLVGKVQKVRSGEKVRSGVGKTH
ncbi:MAG: hypothetical protein HQL65_08240 [Magnetococcales bacterium]|nr:hypothetical protein [Magnetococcales bacterium]